MDENDLNIGQYSCDENIFLEDVIIDDIENWTSDEFVDNIPKIIDNSYLKLFWKDNKWYTCYNDNIIESDMFIGESLKKMYINLSNNVK